MSWGVFNDEGLLETFPDRERAERGLSEMVDEDGVRDPHAYVGPICEEPDHSEECAWHCQLCDAESDEDEEDDRD